MNKRRQSVTESISTVRVLVCRVNEVYKSYNDIYYQPTELIKIATGETITSKCFALIAV